MSYFVQNLEHIWVLRSTLLSTMLLVRGSPSGRNPSQVGYSMYLSIHQSLLYLRHFLMFNFPTFCSRAHLALLQIIVPSVHFPASLAATVWSHDPGSTNIALDFPLDMEKQGLIIIHAGKDHGYGGSCIRFSKAAGPNSARVALRSSIRIGRRQRGTQHPVVSSWLQFIAWIWAQFWAGQLQVLVLFFLMSVCE